MVRKKIQQQAKKQPRVNNVSATSASLDMSVNEISKEISAVKQLAANQPPSKIPKLIVNNTAISARDYTVTPV